MTRRYPSDVTRLVLDLDKAEDQVISLRRDITRATPRAGEVPTPVTVRSLVDMARRLVDAVQRHHQIAKALASAATDNAEWAALAELRADQLRVRLGDGIGPDRIHPDAYRLAEQILASRQNK